MRKVALVSEAVPFDATTLPMKTKSAALKLSGGDKSTQSQANEIAAAASMIAVEPTILVVTVKRFGSHITMELTGAQAT